MRTNTLRIRFLEIIQHKMITGVLLLFVLLSWSPIFSQQDEFITGKIIDGTTRSPVPFATIYLKNKAKGVVSNQDGGFKIPIQFRNSGDTLVISSLGYKTKEVLLETLINNKINTIVLANQIENLDEVVVKASQGKIRKKTAEEIVTLAIKNIRRNYPIKPYSYVGYYRDYQLKNENYLNLNEGILEVFDRGFNSIDMSSSKTRIYRFEKNLSFPRDAIAAKPYDYRKGTKIVVNATLQNEGGNEFMLLRIHDAIRNFKINTFSFVYTLERDFKEQHYFLRKPNTYLNDELLYVIEFLRKDKLSEVVGTLYVDSVTYAIHKMEYAVYQNEEYTDFEKERRRQVTVTTATSVPKREKLIFDVNVSYNKVNNLMYLNYISFNNSFQIKDPPKFYVETFVVNEGKRCYEIHFTESPAPNKALKSSKYAIARDGEKIKIDRVEIKGKVAFLYPKNVDDLFNSRKLTLDKRIDYSNYRVAVKNIEDVNGNKLNEESSSFVSQFREFFVQEVNRSKLPPKDNLYMIKTLPIYKNQPIATPDNLEDYWINTPLIKNKEVYN